MLSSKACKSQAKTHREWYQANKEQAKLTQKAWRLANREKVKATQKRYYLANKELLDANRKIWQKANQEKIQAYGRKSCYGIIPEQFNMMLEAQGFACAICRKIPTHTLHVDHNHATGKVRGLLCKTCNGAAGYMNDSPNLCLALANYLDWHEFAGTTP